MASRKQLQFAERNVRTPCARCTLFWRVMPHPLFHWSKRSGAKFKSCATCACGLLTLHLHHIYYSSLSSLYPTGAVQKWLSCRQYQLVSKSYSSSIVVFQIGPLPPLRRKNAAHIKIDWPLLCSQIFWWTPSFSTNRGVIFERFLLNSSADPCTHAKPAPCRHIACAVCTFWILAGTFNLLCCRKECRESSKSAHCGMASVWWWCNRIIYMQRVYSSSL